MKKPNALRRFLPAKSRVDESCFGARRVKGKRGRGAGGKTKVFGIFKRNGSVYTEVVPDCKKKTLQAVRRGRVALDAVVHSDKWRRLKTGWLMSDTVSIFALIIRLTNLSMVIRTSTASKVSGRVPNAACKSLTACLSRLFTCI